MMRSLPLLFALLLPAGAAAQEQMRAGDFRAMSPQRIADALLPSGHPPIAGVAFDRFGGLMPPAPFVATIRTVRFFTTSAPISADFCVQNQIVAEITPMPDDDSARLDSPPRLLRQAMAQPLYRYRTPGTACDGTMPHFSIFGVEVREGLDAYRALVAAQRLAARSRAPLPFRVQCVGMVMCRGARDAMRNLPLGEVAGVSRREASAPGRMLLLFELPLAGMQQTIIAVTLHRGRIERVEHGVGTVMF